MGPAFGPPAETATGCVPLADVSETDDAYLVEVDLPGVKSKDINIEVVGNALRETSSRPSARACCDASSGASASSSSASPCPVR